ncbi:TetR/AcrR family transcriptional regulator C-terminal domain-containing protein [Nonomuraea sp. NPDC049714]|uniref:TetR/AcrR family transcriptional regulator C-terminal domain-containing protein n=1 Tax=Nonomuraea sp. NPDC049714 TaxID=3364357 RepID=UPI00378DAE9A
MVCHVRRSTARHPLADRLARAGDQQDLPGLNTLPVLHAALESLERAGFPPREALRGLLTLSNYVNGFVLEEQASPPQGQRENLDTAHQWLAGHPHLLEVFLESGHPQGEETFEHGLSLILEGMRARLSSAS